MNKVTDSNDDYEMLEDYVEMLEKYDFSKAVRGKYSQQKQPIVKIISDNEIRFATMKTIEVEALVTSNGKLTVEIPSSLAPGKYRAALILEEPVNPPED